MERIEPFERTGKERLWLLKGRLARYDLLKFLFGKDCAHLFGLAWKKFVREQSKEQHASFLGHRHHEVSDLLGRILECLHILLHLGGLRSFVLLVLFGCLLLWLCLLLAGWGVGIDERCHVEELQNATPFSEHREQLP